MRSRWALGLALVLAVGLPSVALAQTEEAPEPTVATNLAGADFGEQVIVSGLNWPANTFVQVEICGNAGERATQDCDQVTAEQSGVSTAGSFSAVLLVGNPPEPCPCVVRTSSLSSDLEIRTPFEVRGAPIAEGDPTPLDLPTRRLVITDARLTGNGPWTSWLGFAADRTLIVTVRNAGETQLDNPPLDLRLGKGGDPEELVEAPDIGSLAPGEETTFTVPIELPSFAFGTYAVEGQFQGFADPVWFRAETTHVPWLLLLLPLLLLAQLALLAIRNRARRAVERSVEEAEPVPIPAALPAAPVVDVIDLREPETADEDEFGTVSVFDPPGADAAEVHEVLAATMVASAVAGDDEPDETDAVIVTDDADTADDTDETENADAVTATDETENADETDADEAVSATDETDETEDAEAVSATDDADETDADETDAVIVAGAAIAAGAVAGHASGSDDEDLVEVGAGPDQLDDPEPLIDLTTIDDEESTAMPTETNEIPTLITGELDEAFATLQAMSGDLDETAWYWESERLASAAAGRIADQVTLDEATRSEMAARLGEALRAGVDSTPTYRS